MKRNHDLQQASDNATGYRHHRGGWPVSALARTRAFLLALLFAALLVSAAPAFAATVTDRPLLSSFDGADTTGGRFAEPDRIAIDDASGSVYVSERSPSEQEPGHHAVSKFAPDGTAANFAATGTSSLFGTPGGPFQRSELPTAIAVDNSGGSSQGRLYVVENSFEGRLSAFAPDGTFLWEKRGVGSFPKDVAVDSSGHPWILYSDSAKEFDNTGSPPAQIGSFPVSEGRAFGIDADGDVYVAESSGVEKYVNGIPSSTIDPAFTADVAVDQSVSDGHIFLAQGNTFKEYDGSGALVGTYGASSIISGSTAIAYNPALDRVYVGDGTSNLVQAFGPQATGTTPDPTIETTVALGPGTAEFHGVVNPQSVPNGYYFEWSMGIASAGVLRSPLQSLPEDSSQHSVSYKATNVLGNTNTRVRLVAVNTETGLRTASGFDEFQPPQAAEPPTVAIGEPAEITESSADIEGTINPHEDSVLWQARVNTDPTCSGPFEQQGLEYLPGGEVSTPQNVEFELTNLLPAQHYCVLLEANNSFQLFGAGTRSAVKEFTTAAIPPSEVQTSFAAPRTDTTTRINGLVNPEGEANFEYHFELSEDGINWTTLPDRESRVDSRSQVFVADELTNLKPGTTYYYRLAGARNNEGGPAGSEGEVRAFTTRTTAEVTFPQRGIEMVNNPDKGNQNVLAQPSEMIDPGISPDGERTVWQVAGGAPGGFNGTFSAFLAERTPTGWQSRSIVPPAAQQVGGGSYAYELLTVNPDFSQFVFSAKRSLLGTTSEETRVRLDAHQHQQILQSYVSEGEFDGPGKVDRTDDASHVLAIDNANHQLEDIGDGSPEVVSLMPDGTPSSCGLRRSPSFVGGATGEGEDTRGAAAEWRPGYHMIDMSDASTVYFEAKPNGECGQPWGLYVRDRGAGKTTLVDPGALGHDSAFIRATPDGHSAYFVTYSKLDSADTNSGADLYRWDQKSEESHCLSCVVPDASISEGGGAYGKVLISDDFSHIYFESEKELVSGQPHSRSGASIYVLTGGTLRYVADAAPSELGSYEVQLSTDGDTLVWRSLIDQTADIVAPNVRRLYLYDDRNASVECLSCVFGGVTTHDVAAATEFAAYHMSADGSTVAFVAGDDLVPRDVNRGKDVYEWRNGVRQLVTNGVSEFSDSFASPLVRGVDADGSNILFSVADPGLTGFEQDRLANLYDARVGGGFEPPSPPVHCAEDSCQGPLQAAPAAGQSSSSAFSGRGNVSRIVHPRRACSHRRGKAKRRCIKRHKKHKRHKRRSQRARDHHNTGRTK